jgi:nitroimidazol reductase NimA-like FMN-containing flavoprotein (pyridoxamine 5'-phosphate oxidase superfamily)
MRETPDDLSRLQQSLDDSYAVAGVHLRSVFRPERRMSAEEIVAELRGVFVLQVATVTASGAPRLAPVDGLFYRGHVCFGFSPGAVRIAHVRARPQVSASYSVGEDVCVLVHGTARVVEEGSAELEAYEDFAREVYTPKIWDYWRRHYDDRKGSGLTAWIEPEKMFAMKAQ